MTTIQFIGYARKFLVAAAAALAIAMVALADNSVSVTEWVSIAIAFLGALGVYSTPNETK